MNRVNIKPLSANELWRGKKWKTSKYVKYRHDLGFLLPKLSIGDPPYKVSLVFGFSKSGCDIDNPIKGILDAMQDKYGIDDNDIVELHVKKAVAPKGSEYFEFSIESIGKEQTGLKEAENYSWPVGIIEPKVKPQ